VKGRFWAENADHFTRMLGAFGEALLEGAALQPGERVLDVGCGNGDVTLAAAAVVAPEGAVLGVDLSSDQLDNAAVRASRADLTNVVLVEGDAGTVDLGPEPFDVLLSRFGVMFFDDPVATFAHLHHAMGPGGRLAFVCWQRVEENEWVQGPRRVVSSVVPVRDLPAGTAGAYSLAEPDHTRGLLTRAGWADVGFEPVVRPVHLGPSADAATAVVTAMEWAREALADASDEQRDEALEAVRGHLAEHALPDGRIEIPGSAWLVTARA